MLLALYVSRLKHAIRLTTIINLMGILNLFGEIFQTFFSFGTETLQKEQVEISFYVLLHFT